MGAVGTQNLITKTGVGSTLPLIAQSHSEDQAAATQQCGGGSLAKWWTVGEIPELGVGFTV